MMPGGHRATERREGRVGRQRPECWAPPWTAVASLKQSGTGSLSHFPRRTPDAPVRSEGSEGAVPVPQGHCSPCPLHLDSREAGAGRPVGMQWDAVQEGRGARAESPGNTWRALRQVPTAGCAGIRCLRFIFTAFPLSLA